MVSVEDSLSRKKKMEMEHWMRRLIAIKSKTGDQFTLSPRVDYISYHSSGLQSKQRSF